MHAEQPQRCILVVVADHDQRLRLSSLLARNRFRVNAVADGAMARTLLCSQQLDLVLYDASLLHDEETDLCRCIKSTPETARMPVLIIASQPGNEQRQAAIDAGADEFLEATASEQELLTLVDELVRIRDVAEQLDIGAAPVVEAFAAHEDE
jgi:two-component system cell cycle response regulator